MILMKKYNEWVNIVNEDVAMVGDLKITNKDIINMLLYSSNIIVKSSNKQSQDTKQLPQNTVDKQTQDTKSIQKHIDTKQEQKPEQKPVVKNKQPQAQSDIMSTDNNNTQDNNTQDDKQ